MGEKDKDITEIRLRNTSIRSDELSNTWMGKKKIKGNGEKKSTSDIQHDHPEPDALAE
jgi:hypothetical protein